MKIISKIILINLYITIGIKSFAENLIFTKNDNNKDYVKSLPGYGKTNSKQFSGYLTVKASAASKYENIYYYLVASSRNPETAPLVLWLNGGPGASSFYGFFTENGPYTIDDQLKLHDNLFGWNTKFNYLIMDQPIGVGYSYASKNYTIANEAQTTQELYLAIVAFYQKYPDLLNHKLFIAGQSYAGHYIPKVAIKILNENAAKKVDKIPLAGIILGDAWVDPLLQQSKDADYAYHQGLIDRQSIKIVDKLYANCAKEINATKISTHRAHNECKKILDFIHEKAGIDLHNIHEPVVVNSSHDKYTKDYAHVNQYLSLKEVKNSLHVTSADSFALFSDKVSSALEIGEQNSTTFIIKELLDRNLNTLIYNGLSDASDCNFLGTSLWLKQLNWKQYNSVLQKPIQNLSGHIIGYVKEYKNLTYMKLLGAGHMAAGDQPQDTLELVEKFINHQGA